MTLISAFASPNGIALCADSKETVTCYDANGNPYDLRKTVQKIVPMEIGKYRISISGAGHADLIESFIVRARRAIVTLDAAPSTASNPAGVNAVLNTMEQELEQFYRTDVALCPDPDKQIKLFIGASCPIANEYALWISENITLRNANSPELIGWDHQLYSETASRLASSNMKLSQAALAGIYTLTIAKLTSNYVGGDLSLATIRGDGIWMEKNDYVKKMESRLSEYENQLHQLFLACADTSVSMPELEDAITKFKETAMNTHREQIDKQAGETKLDDMWSTGLSKLPRGPVYMAGHNFRVEHDRQKIEEADRQWKKVRLSGHAGPVNVTVHCECGENFQVSLPSYQETFSRHVFGCPHCQRANTVDQVQLGDITI